MRTLPLSFIHDGFTYTQVEWADNVALYTQSRGERLIGFEVVKVQWRHANTTPSGSVMEEGEYYPGSSQWGDAGWTYKSLAAAKAQMAALRQPRAAHAAQAVLDDMAKKYGATE